MKTHHIIGALLLLATQAEAQQHTSKLIAKSRWYDNNGTLKPHDSVYMVYGAGKGYDATRGEWQYDISTRVSFNNGETVNRDRTIKKYQGNNVVEQTDEEWKVDNWVPVKKLSFDYQSDKLVSTICQKSEQGSGWQDVYKDMNTYDASNNLTETMHQLSNGSTWENASRKAYTYTGGILEKVNPYEWNNTTSIWADEFQANYHYNGTMLATLCHRYPSGAIDSNMYSYDSKGNLIEDKQYHNISPTEWEGAYTFLYTYDAVGNQTSKTIQIPDVRTSVFTNSVKFVTAYNQANQPVTESRYAWDANSNQFVGPKAVVHYYYEKQEMAVAREAIQTNALQVYPNPANNILTIDLKWNEAQSATIMLLDVTGKLAARWAVPSSTQHTQTLDVSGMASGAYILKVAGEKGQISQKVEIIR